MRAVPHRRGRRGAGAHLPAARARLRALPARADPPADHARGDVHRVRLLLLVLHLLGRARPPVRRRRGRAPRARPRLVRGRGGQQRRLPAPARRRARHPLPGRRAVGQRRRGRPRQGRAHAHGVPHPGDRRAGARAARPGRSRLPQQRLRPHPRRRRLHRGPAGHGRRRRLGVDRGAAPAHADGAHASSTRSTTSTSSTTRCSAASGRSPRAGSALVDVELLPTHGGSIRMWARPAEVAGEPSQAVRDVLAAETAGGPAHRRGPRRVRRGRLPRARRPRRVPHRGAPGGQEGGGLRRAGQGQHAAQLLRHPARPARLHRRPQPLQARPLHPGHAHPDPGARADRRTTGPTTC